MVSLHAFYYTLNFLLLQCKPKEFNKLLHIVLLGSQNAHPKGTHSCLTLEASYYHVSLIINRAALKFAEY